MPRLFNLVGIDAYYLKPSVDERGSFCELLRSDWHDFLHDDQIVQVNLSISHPGTIRAWHRHGKGQIDYVLVLKGSVKIVAYDDDQTSDTFKLLDEIIVGDSAPAIVRIPGKYWHGTKTLGTSQSKILYFITKLYDYEQPDEQRRIWNDNAIIDPRTKKPYDWNAVVHK